MFEYEARGKIRIAGCAKVTAQKNFFVNFPVGARVYIKKKAKMGLLESVVIKKINRVVPNKFAYEGFSVVVSYVDTFNRVWMEDELFWGDEATDYAKIYWLRVQQDAERLLDSQGICYE
jgi:hypothetical protein